MQPFVGRHAAGQRVADKGNAQPVAGQVVGRQLLIQQQPRVYKLDGQDKLRIKLELPGAAERVRTANELLALLRGKPSR